MQYSTQIENTMDWEIKSKHDLFFKALQQNQPRYFYVVNLFFEEMPFH